ncbi:hypothetical protein [Zooshikella sp. RANM57]|uniref:hypothetical protein n=1 Tax=Zooshikella sp. RANM57 TaxID=3425863 RepID=UPI003D6FB83A
MKLLTSAYLHYWDKGQQLPVDLAMRLLEDGINVEALEQKELANDKSKRQSRRTIKH